MLHDVSNINVRFLSSYHSYQSSSSLRNCRMSQASLPAASSESSGGLFNEKNQTSAQVPYSSLSSLPEVSDIGLVSVGLSLNLLIAGRIVTQQRLQKPRHIFYLGVTLSCLFAQLVSLNELFFSYLYLDDRPTCATFHPFLAVPYANLLLNLFFCLLDHYVAITYSMWHTREMKTKWIFIAQLSGLIFIAILFKNSYFLDRSGFSCRLDDGKIVIFTLMTLVVLCIVARVVIYLETKKNFVRQRLVQCPNLPRPQVVEIVEETSMSFPQVNDRRHSNIVMHVGREATDKLEKEAAWTLVLGVVSLLLFSSPIFIAPLSILYCSQVSGSCSSSTWTIPYFLQLILVHTTYMPVVYIWRNRELFTN